MITTSNISLDIKYIFISFAQKYFAEHLKYTWNQDVRQTKLIIADKNSIDLGVAERRPSIILSRGSFSFTNTSIDQRATGLKFIQAQGTETMAGAQGSASRVRNAVYSDLVRGSITFHVLSKYGVQAEDIANELFVALTAFKEDLRAKGINKFTGMNFGEESTLRTTSNIDLAGVALNVGFLKQVTIARGERQYNCIVYVDGTSVGEGIDYKVTTDSGDGGTQIIFRLPPTTGAAITITYVHAITLGTITDASLVGTVDSSNTVFTVPSSGKIYGYYKILDSFDDNVDNQVEYEDL